jgi:asparagine synthetase B (glutamine-hydrolysing)
MTTMPPDVRLELVDPGAMSVAAADGAWYLLGCGSVPAEAIRRLGDGALGGEEFCRRYRDTTVIRIKVVDGAAATVQAWRGLFSVAELFYAVRRAGDVRISDHFKNILAMLEPSERQTSDRGLVEHFLYRKPSPNVTYSAIVARLGSGEVFSADLMKSRTETELFDRIDAEIEERSNAGYLDLMDGELALAVDQLSDSGTAIMFSGGVDSALLQAYGGDALEPVTFVPDTPEFAAETEYARKAAAVLGVSLNELGMAEASFLDMVEATTDITGFTVFDDAKPYLAHTILTTPQCHLVTGHGADSAFGMSLKLARFSSWFRWPGVLQTVTGLSRVVPGHVGYRLGQVAPKAAGFARPTLHPFGYSANTRSHGNTKMLEQIFGAELIQQANRESLDYVTARVVRQADPGSRFFSHIELAHWMVAFNNAVLIDRLVAHGCGKTLDAPYMAANVLETLATIPVADRYVHGLRAKWILKDLLARRAPAYPINQRKLATALPWKRFYSAGPLSDFWDRYDVPDLFQGQHRDDLVSEPSIVTWTAMTYAVWKARVADNPHLTGHPTVLSAIHPIGSGHES